MWSMRIEATLGGSSNSTLFSVVLYPACHLAQGLIVSMSRVSRQQEALIEQHMLLKAEARKAAEVGHLNAELKAKAGAQFIPVVCFVCGILATRRTASYPRSPHPHSLTPLFTG